MKGKCLKKIVAVVMTIALIMTTAVVALADPTQTAKTNKDIIDTTQTGSLTIYKYDITAATQSGVVQTDLNAATGERDLEVEETLAAYALANVEFTYLKVGDIEQYSYTTANGTEVRVVYEIPAALAVILGLGDAEGYVLKDDGSGTIAGDRSTTPNLNIAATDMTASGISTTCTKSDVYHYTSDQINTALSTILANGNTAAKNALEAYVSTDGTAMDYTNASGMTTADGLTVGLYLIVETAVPENVSTSTDPFFVSIPSTTSDGESWNYDVTVYPKNQTTNPDVDKKVKENDTQGYVDTTTASEGDVLDFIIVSKLPKITSTTTYLTGYEFVDTLSKGLTVNSDDYGNAVVNVAIYSDRTAADANNMTSEYCVAEWTLTYSGQGTVSAGVNYVNTYETQNGLTVDASNTAPMFTISYDTSNNVLTVTPAAAGLAAINPAYSEYYIVVSYQVTVNSGAETVLGDEGNANDVELTWSRTSGYEDQQGGWHYYKDKIEDRAIVYVYGIQLTKLFSDGNGHAENVKFNLYNNTDGYYVVAKTVTADIPDSNGNKPEDAGYTQTTGTYYYVTGTTDDVAQATVFIPNVDGSLYIYGLEADTYLLTETETDSGYSLLEDQIKIAITSASRNISAAVAGWTGYGYSYEYTYTYDGSAISSVNGNEVTFTYNNTTYVYNTSTEKFSQNGTEVTDATEIATLGAYLEEYKVISETTVYINYDGEDYKYTCTGELSGNGTLYKYNGTSYETVTNASSLIETLIAYLGDNSLGKVELDLGTLTSGSATVDNVPATMLNYFFSSNSTVNSNNSIVTLTITNTKTFTLPQTGGMGLYIITIAGVVVVAAGCYFVLGKKGKKKES